MQATIEIITNPIDVTQGTTETTQSMTFDISPSFIKGDDGITPHIGANGNWYIGTTDTNVKARATDGTNGVTPHIGDNGNWFFGTTDSGVKASGNDGHSPVITATKNGTTTTINSDGVAIATINDGEDGTTDYNELTNKPTIPSKTSDLSNDSGFLTAHQDISTKLSVKQTLANGNIVLTDGNGNENVFAPAECDFSLLIDKTFETEELGFTIPITSYIKEVLVFLYIKPNSLSQAGSVGLSCLDINDVRFWLSLSSAMSSSIRYSFGYWRYNGLCWFGQSGYANSNASYNISTLFGTYPTFVSRMKEITFRQPNSYKFGVGSNVKIWVR